MTSTLPRPVATKKPIWLIGIVVCVVVLAVGAYLLLRQGSGRTDQQAVRDYVADLNAGNATSLSKDIYPGGMDTAKNLIAAAKGRPWHIDDITISHDFGPSYGVAHLNGMQGQQAFSTTLPLQRHDGRWYVSTGARGQVPTTMASQTASTQP